MKSTWTLVLAIVLVSAAGMIIADDASAEPEFPSMDRIFDTVEPPDYSFDRFVSDFQTMFSESMFRQMANYTGDLFGFLMNDTFIGGNGSFSGAESYINIFVLACLIIAVICVLGAFISYFANRSTFVKRRND